MPHLLPQRLWFQDTMFGSTTSRFISGLWPTNTYMVVIIQLKHCGKWRWTSIIITSLLFMVWLRWLFVFIIVRIESGWRQAWGVAFRNEYIGKVCAIARYLIFGLFRFTDVGFVYRCLHFMFYLCCFLTGLSIVVRSPFNWHLTFNEFAKYYI